MSTTRIVLSIVISVVFIVFNLFYWWKGMGLWQEAFRLRCQRRFRVTIHYGGKGHWDIYDGGSWYRNLAIEMLQLAYFMTLFAGWAMALGVGAFLLWLFGRLTGLTIS